MAQIHCFTGLLLDVFCQCLQHWKWWKCVVYKVAVSITLIKTYYNFCANTVHVKALVSELKLSWVKVRKGWKLRKPSGKYWRHEVLPCTVIHTVEGYASTTTTKKVVIIYFKSCWRNFRNLIPPIFGLFRSRRYINKSDLCQVSMVKVSISVDVGFPETGIWQLILVFLKRVFPIDGIEVLELNMALISDLTLHASFCLVTSLFCLNWNKLWM